MNREDKLKMWLESLGCKHIRVSEEYVHCTCPFHETTRGPQFSINSKTGYFGCFSGKCGVSGNIETFLVEAMGWSPRRAKLEAENFDEVDLDQQIVIPDYEDRKQPRRPENEVVLSEGILELYRQCPKYMLDRGFSKKVLKSWEIGYDNGSCRVTFPVRNRYGELVGTSKRATREYDSPKYLHLHFSKGQYLYGLHRIPDENTTPVFVVEGQADVLAIYQMGGLAVSTMGTRVSKRQLKLITGLGNVILAFDNDEDGQQTREWVELDLVKKMQRNSLRSVRFPESCKDAADLLKQPISVQKQFMKESLECQ